MKINKEIYVRKYVKYDLRIKKEERFEIYFMEY